MNWILIVLVVSTSHQTMAPALTKAEYRTESACQAAGAKVANDFNTKNHSVRFSCSKKE